MPAQRFTYSSFRTFDNIIYTEKKNENFILGRNQPIKRLQNIGSSCFIGDICVTATYSTHLPLCLLC